MTSTIERYKKLLKVLNNLHTDGLLHTELDNRFHVESYITTLTLREKFKINFEMIRNTWTRVDEFSIIGLFGKKHGRIISWSDDKSQPKDEWLYCISFPCGAYSFHEEYPVKTFDEFFNELKNLNPKYSDTANHSLYFSYENACEAHTKYKELFTKYKASVHKELKDKRIEKLKEEIKNLMEE